MLSNYRVFRTGDERVSVIYDKKAARLVLAGFILLFLTVVIGASLGSVFINPLDALRYLIGVAGDEYDFIIGTLRLPRILLALLAGGALGVSGLILQSVIKNPLASPDIIGITGGAKLVAVILLTLPNSINLVWLPFAAIGGAALASLLMYLLAWKHGTTALRLVLIGIGIEAALGALVTMVIVYSPIYSTSEAYIWIVGSVYGSNWRHVQLLFPWLATLLPLSLFLTRKIAPLELGDEIATGIGFDVEKNRKLLIGISVGLAGSAIAFAGGISFVGLIAPHLAKKIISRSYGVLILLSFVIGAIVVVSADILARTLFLPLDIPCGVFVSGVGAPFFVYLLLKEHR